MEIDDNPRPFKRQRMASDITELSSSSLVTKPGTAPAEVLLQLTPLPPAILLVSLPGILIHPPNHRHHVQSLCISLLSVRKCLSFQSLTPDIECRAWTALAEIGMSIIGGGFSQSDDHPWARGIENDVEKATSKGLLISQKHPSLRAFRPHLTLLSARLSQWQHNTKFARNILRRLLTTFLPSDPPHIIYSSHLAFIDHLLTPPPPNTTSTTHPAAAKKDSSPPQQPSQQDIHAAISAIQTLHALSTKNTHSHVSLLALVLRLRVLVASGMWDQVQAALNSAEAALGITYTTTPLLPANTNTNNNDKTPTRRGSKATLDDATTPTRTKSTSKSSSPQVTYTSFQDDAFKATMAIHTLIIGVIFHTYGGSVADTTPRLTHLHLLLDEGALGKVGNGVVEIQFPTSPPLYIQTTHPRVLYSLAFLVSSVAKRDPVGRKPKRKVFATEGLISLEREVRREILLPPWAGLGDIQEVEVRMAEIKADLLCELVGVCIMRSEFDAAEHNLSLLIAHTRTTKLFEAFAARITLHHAHLAHALGRGERALECYRVARYLDREGEGGEGFVGAAALVGEVGLRVGMRAGGAGGEVVDGEAELEEMGAEVVRGCKGKGATLEAVGQVIEACLSTEILQAKQHLKKALGFATKAQDNHLRALILALISSHYFHTSVEHAQTMLSTCEQLAAGLGAVSGGKAKGAAVVVGEPVGGAAGITSEGDARGEAKKSDMVGNAALRLWVGERFLELYKRTGDDNQARRQAVVNRKLVDAVGRIAERASG